MKHILAIFLLVPFIVFSQAQPKPKPKPATKPSTTVKKPVPSGKKPTGTPAKKPAPGPKKANPAVIKLTEQAYTFYRESKDVECEKVIKKILALDPKNRDAFLLRSYIAMFAGKNEEMWKNLDKLYKLYPAEPDVYSQFAMTHLNYYFLSDSAKRVLCRKTIRLASNRAEGYASLGMVALVGGYYGEAMQCFDVSFSKYWKDTTARTIINMYYARCLYETGDTLGAIARLDNLIAKMQGKDRYTCIFLRAKYKLDMNNMDVSADMDTLNNYEPNIVEVQILTAKYLKKTNRADSACKIARLVRLQEGGEAFDLSEYCNDLTKTIDIAKNKTLSYSLGKSDLMITVDQFRYPELADFTWSRSTPASTKVEHGIIKLSRKSLDSARTLSYAFTDGISLELDYTAMIWLSKTQFDDIAKDSVINLAVGDQASNTFKMIGHEQIDIFDAGNKEMLVDCLMITDGETRISYLNDPSNPLIVKMETDGFTMFLTKIE